MARRKGNFLAVKQNGGIRLLKRLMWVGVAFGVIIALGLTAAIATGLYFYDDYADELLPPEELAVNKPYDGAKIFDRNGEFLYELVDELNGLRRPVAFEDISKMLIAATVATEDASFFDNSGINVRGLARAGWENFNPFGEGDILEGSGGSSISQQLAKNLYIPEDERTNRSIDRKVREAVYALELTRQYSKEQILTWYLNQISYGGIFYGAEAASEGYFGKSASELTLAEAALLAGIPQSPSAYEPLSQPDAAKNRRNQVLELIREQRTISIGNGRTITFTDAQIDAAKEEPLAVRNDGISLTAPHFVFSQVIPQLQSIFGRDALYQDGFRVTTSIDMKLQREAEAILERWITEFEETSNSRNGAVIVIEPQTGEILTYAGSRDFYREDIEGKNDNILSLNSPGSSFKPFVYLTAFAELGWSPGTVLVDEPTTFREDDGTVFQPTNPVDRYYGRITIRNALGNSLNIPPFKAAMSVGVDRIVESARRYGFSTLTGQYGPAIAIGGVDLTALDLTYAYAMLANGGVMRGIPANPEASDQLVPVAVLTVQNRAGDEIYDSRDHLGEKRIAEEAHAFMITSILADPRAQCITFGCGGITVPGFNVAVKTGTSEPFDPNGPDAGKIGDTWAFGYTRDYVVGIWAGNADNAPITNIYSTSISFRSMRDVLVAAYGDREQTPFEKPDTVVEASNCSTREIAVGCQRDLVFRPPENGRDGEPRGQGTPDNRDGDPRAQGTPNDRDGDDRDDNDRDEDEAVAEFTPTPRPNVNPGPTPRRGGDQVGSSQGAAGQGAGGASQGGGTTQSGAVSVQIASASGAGTVTVSGSIRGPVTGYTVEVQSGGTWQTVGGGSGELTGTLGAFSTAGLPPGTYSVRITATGGGTSASDTASFTVQ